MLFECPQRTGYVSEKDSNMSIVRYLEQKGVKGSVIERLDRPFVKNLANWCVQT